MKIKTIVFTAAITLAASASFAGLGTSNMGLPQNWSLLGTEGYGSATSDGTNIDGNPASAMCVGCHTVNPSLYIKTPAANGSLTTTTLSGNNNMGTHFVMNLWGTPAATTALNGQTGTGGQNYGIAPTAGTYENVSTNWTSGARSKYQDAASATLKSQLTAGDMICESCHTLVPVTAKSNLLLAEYVDNGNSNLCEGCHGDMHTNGNLAAFESSKGTKRHHVMNNSGGTKTYVTFADTLTTTGYATGKYWAPSYSSKVDTEWCTTAYKNPLTDGPTVLDLATGEAITFRGECNVAGAGTFTEANVKGDINPPSATQVHCSSCHRPHNAATNAGAFILRNGSALGANLFVGVKGNSRAVTTNYVAYGIRRGIDVGTSNGKVYGEYDILCKGCHQGYGN